MFLKKAYWLLLQFGIDPIKFSKSVRGIPAYFRDYFQFAKKNKTKLHWLPCFHDRYDESGVTHSEYFWQDLIVAQRVYENKPVKHVDIGSRIDGFVAHVASFRQVEVFDIREISTQIPNVIFRRADLMDVATIGMFVNDHGYCDSISCLHTIEHFGLGRYGDAISAEGYSLGIGNIAKLLAKGGTLFLSTPIGKERVEFNANRVFNPMTIISTAAINNLEIVSLKVVGKDGIVTNVEITSQTFDQLSSYNYNLGLFEFIKN